MTTLVTDEERPAEPTPLASRRRVLDSLPSGARTTGDQAAARSRMVRRLRIALPILALVLVAAFLFNTQSNEVDDAFLDDFKDIDASAEELSMASPRFAGVDNKGKPFEITAAMARQNTNLKDIVTLDRPHAVQGENNGSTVVSADKGVYRSEQNILELEDQVTLQHEVGSEVYVFRAPSASVAIKDEIVTSDTGVDGEGSNGRELTAERMKAYNGDGRVVFEGNVHMRIYPKNAGPKPDENTANSDRPALKDVDIEKPQ
ncbi:LPS export ABC transporter periplasmic protein LptC [Hyphococcus sp.]|uniref:LPS export ABC transporter periplasmic protein LptC n=1 Tax=Hyphococcus sp. TaxID=2038636 RepID=UPI0035C6AE8A